MVQLDDVLVVQRLQNLDFAESSDGELDQLGVLRLSLSKAGSFSARIFPSVSSVSALCRRIWSKPLYPYAPLPMTPWFSYLSASSAKSSLQSACDRSACMVMEYMMIRN